MKEGGHAVDAETIAAEEDCLEPTVPASCVSDSRRLIATAAKDPLRLLSLHELDYIERFLSTLPIGTEGPVPCGTGIAAPKGRLDAVEKRNRHVESEHKRRNRIKDELLRMSTLVPAAAPTSSGGRARNSQAKLLSQANDYIEGLVKENERMKRLLVNIKHFGTSA